MIPKVYFLIAFALFSVCDSSYVDKLLKCSVSDEECFKKLLSKFLEDNCDNGIPEINIPPLDPFQLKNVVVTVPDLMNSTFIEGTVSGAKKCVINSVKIQSEKGFTKVGLTCDLVLKGTYSLEGTGPILKNLLGGDFLRGDGNMELKLSNIKMNLGVVYHFIKKDGEVYYKCHPEKFQYDCDVGNAHLTADKIFLGKEDATELAVGFFNQNWKMLEKSFGKHFFDAALKIFIDVLQKFLESTSTKHYIIEDLSHLVKNEL